MEMFEGWNKELVFIGIRFRSGLILLYCATEDIADWLKTIVPKVPGWRGTELPTCARNYIPGAHIVMVYLPKAEAIKTRKHLIFLITQNMNPHTHLRSKKEGKSKLLTIGVAAIKRHNCLDNCRFGSIEAGRTGPNREVGLLPIEKEKLNDLDLADLELKSDNETQGNGTLEDNTPSSTHEADGQH